MNSRLLWLKLRTMESKHFWQLRAARQSLGSRTTTARLTASARFADLVGLLKVGARALGNSALLLVLPLIGLWATQSVTRMHAWLQSLTRSAPEWVERLAEWFSTPTSVGFDSAALPTAAIGVAGTFVAVYFATVTFVVSTTYKDATRRLRDQIVRDPESRWYAVFFTQAVVYTALTLALPVVGREATHLTLVIAGLSAALVVLSFGRIWITLFVLLEPTSLFPQIQRNLNRWVHRAYELGNRKRPSAIGARRANEKIRDNLGALDDLVTLILDREHERAGDRGIAASHDPRVGLAIGNLLVSWDSYARRKHAIRTLPGWNPTRTQAKDWFLSSHSEVTVALASGTTLTGSEVVDDLWFERRIAGFIERLLSDRDLRSVQSALLGLPQLSRLLSAHGQFEELRLWLTATTFAPMTALSEYAHQRGPITLPADGSESPGSHISREQHFALPGEASAHNLVDFVLLEALNGCLGYIDYFERMRMTLPSAGSAVTDGGKHLAAGKLVVQMVASLREAIATELSIEGERITSDSAIAQLLARALATEAVDELEQLVSNVEREIWPWVVELGGSKTWAAAAALSRATELSEKLATALRFARTLLDACESTHVEKDDRWPDTSTTELSERLKSLGDQLELPTARLAATVDSAPDSDRPDHFGWAYYRAHENLLRRVLTREVGDPEELRQKVALLYWAGDVATQRLLATVRRHDQGVINSYVAEPYVRWLQLCGVALAVSEVAREPTLFAPFEAIWAALLTDPDRATQFLGRAAATLSSETALFGITPGGVERSGIEIRANNTLDELGVPRGLFDLGGFGGLDGGAEGTASLSDETARLLRSVRSNHFEGMFYARWLRPRAIAAGATVPVDIEAFLRRLDLDKEDE